MATVGETITSVQGDEIVVPDRCWHITRDVVGCLERGIEPRNPRDHHPELGTEGVTAVYVFLHPGEAELWRLWDGGKALQIDLEGLSIEADPCLSYVRWGPGWDRAPDGIGRRSFALIGKMPEDWREGNAGVHYFRSAARLLELVPPSRLRCVVEPSYSARTASPGSPRPGSARQSP